MFVIWCGMRNYPACQYVALVANTMEEINQKFATMVGRHPDLKRNWIRKEEMVFDGLSRLHPYQCYLTELPEVDATEEIWVLVTHHGWNGDPDYCMTSLALSNRRVLLEREAMACYQSQLRNRLSEESYRSAVRRLHNWQLKCPDDTEMRLQIWEEEETTEDQEEEEEEEEEAAFG